ncbi:hypothetical protein ACHAXS_006553 [Conticribra weissflogii]
MPSSTTTSDDHDDDVTRNKRKSVRSGGFAFRSSSSAADAAGGGGAPHSFGRSLPSRAAAGFGGVGGTGALTGSPGRRPFDADPRRRRDDEDPSTVERSCFSFDGRSFHSYLYDAARDRHVIVSEVAPFDNGDGDGDDGTGSSSVRITTDLSSSATIGNALDIDPVLGLVCVDRASDEGNRRSRMERRRRRRHEEEGEDPAETLPWLCLYTPAAAFLIRIGFHLDDDDRLGGRVKIDGTILHVVEPFERQLLAAPRGSSIVRIRGAPTAANAFHRCGSVAMLMRHGCHDGGSWCSHWSLSLYHGLPENLLRDTSSPRRRTAPTRIDVGGRIRPASEGEVTTPLRFHREDLVRGAEDTLDAENEAYRSSVGGGGGGGGGPAGTGIADFCFLSPTHSPSASGAFAATSVLVLATDGSVYAASPVLFDGTILPRTMVVDALLRLDAEIAASPEMPAMEARTRQCRAARRYLADAFGFPAEATSSSSSSWFQGSYYVAASTVHPRAGNGAGGAMAWQPRLQGPVVQAPSSRQKGGDDAEADAGSVRPHACIESFGGRAGAGIVDGFVVARVSSPSSGDRATSSSSLSSSSTSSSSGAIHVEFGIVPGEGAVLLPRFDFESDDDRRVIDELVRGTGMYVERALVMEEERPHDKHAEGDDGGTSALALTSASKRSNTRPCSITVDPSDDIMVHVSTQSRVITLTTSAIAVASQWCRAQIEERDVPGGGSADMTTIRTKVWSSLEVNSKDAVLVGAAVSGDVHLGHILLARLSNGSMEAVNITATQCLYEATELMNAKSKELIIHDNNDKALRALAKVQPLHEVLQPLADRVCDGLSKMGKIVGGATSPQDVGPESLAIVIETQRSCDVNVIMPIQEMSRVIHARRQLLVEMHEHQTAELERLTKLLNEWKEKYEANVKRVVELEKNASTLAERSSAVLTAARDLRPQITNAEAEYFKELRRCETNCSKWESALSELTKTSASQCESMTPGGIHNGDVRCLVNLTPEKIAMCHQLLQGEEKILKQLEEKLNKSSMSVKEISTAISGIHSHNSAQLHLVDFGKENIGRGSTNSMPHE